MFEKLENTLKLCNHYLVEIVILGILLLFLIPVSCSGCAEVIRAFAGTEKVSETSEEKGSSIRVEGRLEHRPQDVGQDRRQEP